MVKIEFFLEQVHGSVTVIAKAENGIIAMLSSWRMFKGPTANGQLCLVGIYLPISRTFRFRSSYGLCLEAVAFLYHCKCVSGS